MSYEGMRVGRTLFHGSIALVSSPADTEKAYLYKGRISYSLAVKDTLLLPHRP